MIEGNILKFGYGSILLNVNLVRSEVYFSHIKPPVEIGSRPLEGSYSIENSVGFTYGSDIHELIKQLKSVDEVNNTIKFRDYIFDFTHYNEKSVDVVIRGLKEFCYMVLRVMAC